MGPSQQPVESAMKRQNVNNTYQLVDTVLSLDDPQQCLIFPLQSGNWFTILNGDYLSFFPLILYASSIYTFFGLFDFFLITGFFPSFISFFSFLFFRTIT